ncbi:PREDICTED: migration and invasion-inhibitory protein isoform X7 [Condylura cristata]|uniref:migration and invasion-inhibitory protein isoform X7 n=1 Tax=Condylura cristata TaxID=143302 RepID=UPI000642E1E0|nr:PREDICTED: migration and invasion-inhibitory protein isoform X7 [Condylura cristata]XP_012578213.1 PREDICTED: migration and invasion-inhibitory protein isoform X7 [Condylura cristata]
MGETEDLVQLRQLNLELLRQLWAGQEAMRRAVARAASESSLDASSGGNSEMLSSRETSLTSVGASCPEETPPGDPWGVSWPCGASSGENSLPPGTCQHWTSLGRPRACSAPSVTTWDSSESPLSTEQNREGPPEAQAPRSLLDQRSNLPQPRVTFCKESPVPERNWRLRPYLGYDWIAGSLDSSSPVTSKPEAFFSELWHFRDANREECVCNDQGSPFLGLRERGDVPEDHEWRVSVSCTLDAPEVRKPRVRSARATRPAGSPSGREGGAREPSRRGPNSRTAAACHGPHRRVLLPRQPAPVSGAFGSWRPLPPVQDAPGPAGP